MATPKLRVKEFKEDYKMTMLRDLSKKITRKNKDFSVVNVYSNSAVYGIIKQEDFFDKSIANDKNLDGYYIVENGDFVYNPRISKEAPYGPINLNKNEEAGVLSPLYLCFSTNGVCNDWIGYT